MAGASVTIGGIAVPASIFEDVANAIIGGVKNGKTPEDVIASLAPDALAVAELIAGALVPYGGAVIELLAFIYSKSIPFKSLSQEEQNAWFDRFGAGGTSA